MMTLRKTALSALVAAACLSLAPAVPPAAANDRRDQEMARKALLEGRIRSLSEIIQLVKPQFPGTILGVELEIENGRFVYEFDILDPSGRLKELEVDAATGKILKIEDDD